MRASGMGEQKEGEKEGEKDGPVASLRCVILIKFLMSLTSLG